MEIKGGVEMVVENDLYLFITASNELTAEEKKNAIEANQIVVKSLDAKIYYLSIDVEEAKVSDVKDLLEQIIGIPTDHQRLIFRGKQLEDEKILNDYDITYGDLIFLVPRLRGDIGEWLKRCDTPIPGCVDLLLKTNTTTTTNNNTNVLSLISELQHFYSKFSFPISNEMSICSILQPKLVSKMCETLIEFAKENINDINNNSTNLGDSKLELSRQTLCTFIGSNWTQFLENQFKSIVQENLNLNNTNITYKIRKVNNNQLKDHFIPFHFDVGSLAICQVVLETQAKEEGGELVLLNPITKSIINVPRIQGTISVHTNNIAHGVNVLGGNNERWSLFLILNQN